jgi:hypothetical protein
MLPVSALPETLMFCALELVPKLALKPESAAGVTVTEGPLTAPDRATLRVVTPWVTTVRLPARVPLCGEAANRTEIVVAGKTPALLGVSVSTPVVKSIPSVECSNP